MAFHQIFSLFDSANTTTYYPEKEAVIAGKGWGVTTTAGDSVFAPAGKDALIRSLLIPPTTVSVGPFPIIEVDDAAGDTVFRWVMNDQVAGNNLCGPDGFLVPGGFSVHITGAAGGYISIVYDVV